MYARSNEKDLQNIFQYVGNMGVTKTVTVDGKVFVIVNGLIQSIT
jgi:predicted type IV restriction endonuclease